MIVTIQGTKNFKDYSIFLRAMGTALSSKDPEDKEFFVYAIGSANINSMGLEFMNITERSLKAQGIRSRLFKVPPSWVKDNVHDIDYFAYFSKPKEPVSSALEYAESKSVDIGIYRF